MLISLSIPYRPSDQQNLFRKGGWYPKDANTIIICPGPSIGSAHTAESSSTAAPTPTSAARYVQSFDYIERNQPKRTFAEEEDDDDDDLQVCRRRRRWRPRYDILKIGMK